MLSFLLFVFVICIAIGAEPIVARRRVSSRDWPQDDPEYEILDEPKSVWSCVFDRNDCGIVNDALVGHFFQLSTAQLSARTGKQSMLLLNITRIPSTPSGARLITPYFQSKHHSKGCLTIDYTVGGDGIKNLVIYQQETQNRCLWKAVVDNSPMKTANEWQKLSLGVDLQYGDPRYFIESHFDNRRPHTGFVAISAVNFFHNACKRNDANECGTPVSNEPDDSTSPTEDDDYLNDLP